MRQLTLAVAVLTLTLPVGAAQAEQNLPNKLVIIEAGGVKVRYLDFGWNEEGFTALEKGEAPARSWALARILTPKPIIVDGHPVTGGALLILNPARGGDPMTLEIRMVDMRDVFADPNVIAEPPAGETIYKVPASFETVDAVADRLTMNLEEVGDTMKLSIHYGNRLRVLEAER